MLALNMDLEEVITAIVTGKLITKKDTAGKKGKCIVHDFLRTIIA